MHENIADKVMKKELDYTIKEICSWLPPFCKANLPFIQPKWQRAFQAGTAHVTKRDGERKREGKEKARGKEKERIRK